MGFLKKNINTQLLKYGQRGKLEFYNGTLEKEQKINKLELLLCVL